MESVALLVVIVALCVVLVLQERHHAAERRHLTHIIVAEHVGEVRVLDSAPTREPAERPRTPNIEGLS